jgi:hypothetical protein
MVAYLSQHDAHLDQVLFQLLHPLFIPAQILPESIVEAPD